MRPLLSFTLALSVLFIAPSAGAQEHEHGSGGMPMAVVLHDGPDSGRAVVGGLTHLGFALLDKTGAPIPHQDAKFTLTQAGQVVFSSDSTHEYDGLFSFDVVFPRPGPYEVRVTSGELGEGVFVGEAVMPANETEARLLLEPAPGEGATTRVTAQVVDAAGQLIPHTDVILEVRTREAGRLVTRVHAHIHDEPVVATLPVFARFDDGVDFDYDVHGTAYLAFPTGRGTEFRAVTAVADLDPVTPFPTAGLPPAPTTDDPLGQVGPTASDGGYTLHAMLDPQRLVGLDQPVRLAALVVDANATPVAHVDFEVQVRGPQGLVFSSQTLHEYDGVFELVQAGRVPGVYEAIVTATRGDVEMSVPVSWTVAPPVAPLAPGVHTVSMELASEPVAGVAVPLRFLIADAAGIPLAHAEVDVAIVRGGEAAALQFKLHSHDDGTMAADVAFPAEGLWQVRVDPATLMPQASVIVGPSGPNRPIVFDVEVAPGAPALLSEPIEGDVGEAPVPAAPLGLGLALLALVAAARRRA